MGVPDAEVFPASGYFLVRIRPLIVFPPLAYIFPGIRHSSGLAYTREVKDLSVKVTSEGKANIVRIPVHRGSSRGREWNTGPLSFENLFGSTKKRACGKVTTACCFLASLSNFVPPIGTFFVNAAAVGAIHWIGQGGVSAPGFALSEGLAAAQTPFRALLAWTDDEFNWGFTRRHGLLSVCENMCFHFLPP